MLKGGCSGGPVALVGFGNAVSFSLVTSSPPDSAQAASAAVLYQDATAYAASDLFDLGCVLRFLLQGAVTHPAYPLLWRCCNGCFLLWQPLAMHCHPLHGDLLQGGLLVLTTQI